MKHERGKVIVINKPHDDHDNLSAVIQDRIIHQASGRPIYRVLVTQKGVQESRHYNEEHLR